MLVLSQGHFRWGGFLSCMLDYSCFVQIHILPLLFYQIVKDSKKNLQRHISNYLKEHFRGWDMWRLCGDLRLGPRVLPPRLKALKAFIVEWSFVCMAIWLGSPGLLVFFLLAYRLLHQLIGGFLVYIIELLFWKMMPPPQKKRKEKRRRQKHEINS